MPGDDAVSQLEADLPAQLGCRRAQRDESFGQLGGVAGPEPELERQAGQELATTGRPAAAAS